MARNRFGGDLQSFIVDLVGRYWAKPGSAPTLTFWNGPPETVGRVQHTDLRTLDAPTVPVSTITAAAVGTWQEFEGPDDSDLTRMWASADGGASGAWVTTSTAAAATNEKTATFVTEAGPTKDALSAAIGTEVEAMSGPGQSLYLALASQVSARAYGVRPTNTAAENDAGLAALFANHTGATDVVFPEVGVYQFSAPLPDRGSITYRGVNRDGTELRWMTGSALAPTGQRQNIVFENLRLSGWAGHLIELGSTGYLANCTFRNCWLTAASNTASIVHGTDGSGFQEILFDKCLLLTQAASTVSPFDITTSGGKLNSNEWRNCTVTRGVGAAGPIWKLTDLTSPIYNPVFKNIVGQLNPGGLIHLTTPFGLTIEDVYDADMGANAYAASLVKIDKAAAGPFPGPMRISNMGNRGGTLGAGVFHVEVTAATQAPPLLDRIGDSLVGQKVSFFNGYGASIPDGSGMSGVIRTVTASTTLTATRDGTVVFNGSSLTATLPDPTTVIPGRIFRVKNIHSTALTVASAGTSKTIDGAATDTLAQWETGRYISDGTQWLTV